MSSSIQNGLQLRKSLGATELATIRQLVDLCNEHDHLAIKLVWSMMGDRPKEQINDFLYYVDGRLVGYLGLFCFNTREGEVSGMVHPAFRRRGIAHELLGAARRQAGRRGLQRLLLIVEQASTPGLSFVRGQRAELDHSEFKMVLEEPRLVEEGVRNALIFRRARAEDRMALAHLTAEAFHLSEDEVLSWYSEGAIERPANRRFYVGELAGQVIGKIEVSHTASSALILGFAVAPAYQGRGHGRQMLASTVQDIHGGGQTSIWLEVATENRRALSLYQSCGFKETGAYDYFRLALLGENG